MMAMHLWLKRSLLLSDCKKCNVTNCHIGCEPKLLKCKKIKWWGWLTFWPFWDIGFGLSWGFIAIKLQECDVCNFVILKKHRRLKLYVFTIHLFFLVSNVIFPLASDEILVCVFKFNICFQMAKFFIFQTFLSFFCIFLILSRIWLRHWNQGHWTG